MKSETLHLNQSSLQDFQDCPRRFQLGHLEDTIWPAVRSDPPSQFEDLTDLGNQFHLLANRLFSGVSRDLITARALPEGLTALWDGFYPYAETLLPLEHYPEQILRCAFHDTILVAKYDLIVRNADDSLLIIDWKTSPHKPERSRLASRLQTILYPFILLEGFSDLFGGGSSDPVSIVMQYWYPLSSEPAEVFPYSRSQHEEVAQKIARGIARIRELQGSGTVFPLTDDLTHCRHCQYQSYCERGNNAIQLDPASDFQNEDLSGVFFDLDDINEIEF